MWRETIGAKFIPPFTRWVTYGAHLYRRVGERCDVEFVDGRTGKRRTTVDNAGHIVHFPGIKKGVWADQLASEWNLQPVVRSRTSFQRYNDAYYIMIWEVQPDGRYWEDSDGLGGNGDVEICLYALIDHRGHFDDPFCVYSVGGKRKLKE